jgi:hypothetical protein
MEAAVQGSFRNTGPGERCLVGRVRLSAVRSPVSCDPRERILVELLHLADRAQTVAVAEPIRTLGNVQICSGSHL